MQQSQLMVAEIMSTWKSTYTATKREALTMQKTLLHSFFFFLAFKWLAVKVFQSKF